MNKLMLLAVLATCASNAGAKMFTFEDACASNNGTVFTQEVIDHVSSMTGKASSGLPYTGLIETIPEDNSIIEKRIFYVTDANVINTARSAYYNSDFIDICYRAEDDIVSTAIGIRLSQD